MTASLSILRHRPAEPDALQDDERASNGVAVAATMRDTDQFAREQVRNLVRRVFLQGWPRPARQVVFSAVTAGLEIASICREVGEALAAERVGRVALVDACLQTQALEHSLGKSGHDTTNDVGTTSTMRRSSRPVAPNLCLVSANTFLESSQNEHNTGWLCSRLGDLRREFDFAVIHGPDSESGSNSAFLGHLSDGLVLVLEAHRTRRLTAMRIREQLVTAKVRLLGVVLCDRNFPIPEKLYQRL